MEKVKKFWVFPSCEEKKICLLFKIESMSEHAFDVAR